MFRYLLRHFRVFFTIQWPMSVKSNDMDSVLNRIWWWSRIAESIFRWSYLNNEFLILPCNETHSSNYSISNASVKQSNFLWDKNSNFEHMIYTCRRNSKHELRQSISLDANFLRIAPREHENLGGKKNCCCSINASLPHMTHTNVFALRFSFDVCNCITNV